MYIRSEREREQAKREYNYTMERAATLSRSSERWSSARRVRGWCRNDFTINRDKPWERDNSFGRSDDAAPPALSLSLRVFVPTQWQSSYYSYIYILALRISMVKREREMCRKVSLSWILIDAPVGSLLLPINLLSLINLAPLLVDEHSKT